MPRIVPERKRTNERREKSGCARTKEQPPVSKYFFAHLFPRSYLRKSVTVVTQHEYIYIYIFDFRKKGKLFFESIYIYILQRIKTEK